MIGLLFRTTELKCGIVTNNVCRIITLNVQNKNIMRTNYEIEIGHLEN